jgi:hypothetical protein
VWGQSAKSIPPPTARSGLKPPTGTAGGGGKSAAVKEAVTDRAAGMPAPHERPGGGDTVLAELYTLAGTADWATLRAFLARYSTGQDSGQHSGRDSGQDLSALAGNLCAHKEADDGWLAGELAAAGDDPLARLVLGAHTVQRAWRVRTGKRAVHVSREQFDTFHSLLREAEEHLYRSAALDRASAAPWYFLLVSGRGLQVDVDIAERRFEAVVNRCPGHVAAHRQQLQTLSRKWSGSHERMHAFALESLHGPHGAALGELVASAHIERWLDFGNEAADARRAYICGDSVRAELQEAADRSINQPGFGNPRSPYTAYNLFAMAFGLAEMWPQSLSAFKSTEGVVAGSWGYLKGTPVEAYTRMRNKAFERA